MRFLLASTGFGTLAALLATPRRPRPSISTAVTHPGPDRNCRRRHPHHLDGFGQADRRRRGHDQQQQQRQERRHDRHQGRQQLDRHPRQHQPHRQHHQHRHDHHRREFHADRYRQGRRPRRPVRARHRPLRHPRARRRHVHRQHHQQRHDHDRGQPVGRHRDRQRAHRLAHQNGKISVLGNNSVGIRTGAVSGNVIVGSGSRSPFRARMRSACCSAAISAARSSSRAPYLDRLPQHDRAGRRFQARCRRSAAGRLGGGRRWQRRADRLAGRRQQHDRHRRG